MRSHIADSRGRASANQDRSRALQYDIRGTGTDAHIANSGGRHAGNNDCRAARRYYRTSHMRYDPGHHWTGMHIRDSRGRRHTASFREPVGPKTSSYAQNYREVYRGQWLYSGPYDGAAKQFQRSRVYAKRSANADVLPVGDSERPSRARNALSAI